MKLQLPILKKIFALFNTKVLLKMQKKILRTF